MPTHQPSHPAILYLGTPVVLVSSLNEDGSANLAPMSSAFWLGWRCLIGLATHSKTAQNLLRTGECVLNLPSQQETAQVDRLALTTGTDPVPAAKAARGYRHEHDKFALAGFTPDRWRPLIMSFQKFCGLSETPVGPSTLASVPEAAYRSPDMLRAQALARSAGT